MSLSWKEKKTFIWLCQLCCKQRNIKRRREEVETFVKLQKKKKKNECLHASVSWCCWRTSECPSWFSTIALTVSYNLVFIFLTREPSRARQQQHVPQEPINILYICKSFKRPSIILTEGHAAFATTLTACHKRRSGDFNYAGHRRVKKRYLGHTNLISTYSLLVKVSGKMKPARFSVSKEQCGSKCAEITLVD